MYLLADQDAEVTDENHAPATPAAHPATPSEVSLGSRVVQDLIRDNIMLGVTNLMAKIKVHSQRVRTTEISPGG